MSSNNIQSRLKLLESRLNPTVGAPVMVFADDSTEFCVGGVVVYRLPHEDADAFFSRCSAMYDQQFGNRPALSVRVRCAEDMAVV